MYTTHMRRLFAHFCRRVCEFSVTLLPTVPMRISVSFVPALNTVVARSFVLSSEKKLLVRQFHRVKTLQNPFSLKRSRKI